MGMTTWLNMPIDLSVFNQFRHVIKIGESIGKTVFNGYDGMPQHANWHVSISSKNDML